ncbi:MAG: hypothetical protein WCR48_04135 [Bacteroidales bacterium]
MRIKEAALFILFIVASVTAVSAKNDRKTTSVAIVIDENTYAEVKSQVLAYALAINNVDRKNTHLILISDKTSPDFVRDTLKSLHEHDYLEGAVLIGNVPIPMIRHAHHLATAFKMNPKSKWQSSSIPSDRYYDDFGLQFDFLKQDEKDDRLYYYDLSPKGDQAVNCDIYSARIKPAKTDYRYSFNQLIAEFLTKAVNAKNSPEKFDNAFHFGGHGNSSESVNARIDEDRAMYEQFGFSRPDEAVHFFNYDEDKFVKARIREILSEKTLDYAHLHTHGADDAQYLSKEPYAFMSTDHIESLKSTLRGKMRSAKDTLKAKQELMIQFDVPESWLKGYDDPSVEETDSLRDAAVDILLPDFDGYASGVKVLILDACFNGAFIHDDYVAARYAFGHGSSTLAVFGNSVNIIQDHWKNELAGLMAYGACIGNCTRQNMTLESHLFGDPTFSFAAKVSDISNLDLTLVGTTEKMAKKMAESDVPDICGYGIKWLAAHNEISPEKLLDIMSNDNRMNVRMEAFMSIVRLYPSTPLFINALKTGLCDSYELIRRMSARYAEICGAPEMLEPIVRHYLDPKEAGRVRYHLSEALGLYAPEEVILIMDSVRGRMWPEGKDYDAFVKRLTYSWDSSEKEISGLSDKSVSLKDKGLTVTGQRNACEPSAVKPLLSLVADDSEDEELRVKAAEALGWYVYSDKRPSILQSCEKLYDKVGCTAVKEELERTIACLK